MPTLTLTLHYSECEYSLGVHLKEVMEERSLCILVHVRVTDPRHVAVKVTIGILTAV